ncbi:16069_t:CDS:1, partial [Funneliformis geosporum]
ISPSLGNSLKYLSLYVSVAVRKSLYWTQDGNFMKALEKPGPFILR